jgi:hypothetical protein
LRGLGSGDETSSESSSSSGAATRSTTAVSPTIQQQFTPQISPVFQQSSGGGSQTASTQQIAPGGQSGQGGSAADAPNPAGTPNAGYGYTAPGYSPSAALPSLAADPFGNNADIVRYGVGSGSLVAQQKDNSMFYILGFAALIGVGALIYVSQKKAKKTSV